ncbi:DUF605-domain-containing protein [Fomitiporia mediterranea MF3/22]|uniref:DUF605-domain-containing protein n=1 Tax=Fomitiporia mediterranea (strain MF3/22) TaxID=694068 RepID=UPI0004409033|nr:DUF605-domain-containing protein [Fomitiporia mediterranea MF3/22]EJD04017.1 DUF605-domain-containing protein [Fomitiporia mediterranea MF3/22]
MASIKLSNMLPPLPASLRSISSYIQRAEELRTKDPVMAYWCTYYAAQLGLDLKSHETGARDYLFALITFLEEMKKDLGANDAIEHEAAGAAYVENFALKVFALADNEDRRGDASRSTAKKFLAAANFLELLRVFEKTNNAEVNNEKIRYAKWKASDIAKAFREGRKPTPGPAGHESEVILDGNSSNADTPSIRTPADRSPVGAPAAALSPDSASQIVPPPQTPPTLNKFPGPVDVPRAEISSSGSWSTVATPGSEAVGPSSATRLAFTSALNRWKGQADVDTSTTSFPPNSQGNIGNQGRDTAPTDTLSRKVHFSPSVVGGLSSTDGSPPPSPTFNQNVPINVPPRTDYVPAAQAQSGFGFRGIDPAMAPLPDSSPSGSSRASLEGSPPQGAYTPVGRPRSGSSPPVNSLVKPGSSPPGAGGANRGSPPSSRRLSLQSSAPPPPPVAPSPYSHGRDRRSSISNRTSPPSTNGPHTYPSYPQPPNAVNHTPTSTYSSPAALGTGRTNGSPVRAPVSGLPPVTSGQTMASPYVTANYTQKAPSPPTRYTAPAPDPSPPVELSPALIAKAQKHCRYAISALEYEDAEQARKELHAALAVLGER